jgi:hypothetical protein
VYMEILSGPITGESLMMIACISGETALPLGMATLQSMLVIATEDGQRPKEQQQRACDMMSRSCVGNGKRDDSMIDNPLDFPSHSTLALCSSC